MIKIQGMPQFNVDLEAFAKKLEISLGAVCKKVTLDLWDGITRRTPVDTGRARSSWNLAVGQPNGSVPAEGTYGVPGTPDVSTITGKEPIYITSNLEYIGPLENGHSKQAPSGMVMISVAETQAKIEQLMGGVK